MRLETGSPACKRFSSTLLSVGSGLGFSFEVPALALPQGLGWGSLFSALLR